MTSRHIRISGLIAVLIAAPLASPLVAQGVSAQLSGTVKSASGSPVASATVVIRNAETGFVRTVQTDANGRYLAPALPVGLYTVSITKAGFHTASNIKVTLNLGDAAPLNIKLAPESSTTVEVVAVASRIDSERSTVAATVSPTELANLPIKGRSLLDYSSLTPQVAVTGRGQIAIAGSRGVNTSINIDGGDYNSSFFAGSTGTGTVAGSPFSISMEAIREFQVVTDGASAEYGRMGGGFLNAITKSGTNELAGGLFYYHRPSSWVAKEVNVSGKSGANNILDFKTQQYGGSLGGPIIKDKLFYFVAFDFQREKRPQQFTWGGSTAIDLNPANPSDAVLISKAGSFTKPNDGDNLFLRLDWNVSTDHTLQLRMTKSSIKSVYQASAFASAENTANDEYNTTALGLQWNWVIGPNWLSELKVNYNKDDQPRVPKSYSPQVTIGSGVGAYGKVPFTRQFTLKKTQIVETVSYFTPTMQVKAGVDYIINNVFEVFAPFVEGAYTFNATTSPSPASSIVNFRAGQWTQYSQNIGLNGLSGYEAGRFDQKENEYALFVQADWRATPDVKIGAGIRYDKQEHPDFPILDVSNPMAASLPLTAKIPQSSNVSPRLSLTWTPSADKGNTVLRASAGRYVSRTPSIFLYTAYTNNNARIGAYTFNASNVAQLALAQALGIARGSGFNPANPANIPASAFNTLTPAQQATLRGTSQVFTFSQDFKNPVTDRLSLGVERSFALGWVLGATATYAKTENLERITDLNLAETSVNPQGRPRLTRPNSNYGAIKAYRTDASSRYKALTLSAKYQKAESPISGQIFYTWAEAKDNDSNERNFAGYGAQNPLRLNEEWGYGDNDRRHVLVGSLTFLEPFTKIQFGTTLRYYSALPYTPFFTSDLNGDAVFPSIDRPLGTDRNSSRTASQTNVDMRISRDWTFSSYRVTTSIDVFNLLNHADTYQRLKYSGTDAAPVQGQDFKTLTFVDSTLFPTRQVQVGVRLAF